jgi:hypothetical protein
MNNDFQNRVARLNAKHEMIASDVSSLPARGGRSLAFSNHPKGTLIKYIFVAVLILVLLPVAAAVGTLFLAPY